MEIKKLLLIGGGGHCKSVISSIKKNEYEDIGIVDPNYEIGEKILGIPVVGKDQDLPDLKKAGYDHAFISLGSIGNTAVRERLSNILEKLNYNIVNIIDKSAIIDDSVKLGLGVFVGKQAIVNADTEICDFSIINSGAVVEHDCRIGRFTHIAPGAVICGSVNIGDHVHVGANSCIRQGINIGNKVMIGMGSVVIKNIMKEMKTIGNPAKIFNGGGGS